MPQYTAIYSHGENSVGGQMTLDATTDDAAIKEVMDFVRQGYRNETTAGIDLADGSHYQAWNEHGQAKGRRLDA